MAQPAPVPSIEWQITNRCNYECSYCCQKSKVSKRGRHCSPETVEAVLEYVTTLSGAWQVKLIGGEPFVHPRFDEMIQRYSTPAIASL